MHRFRLPPQSGRVLDQAIERDLVEIRAARAVSAEAEGEGLRVGIKRRGSDMVDWEVFDWVIDCTGLEPSPAKSVNPVLLSLLDQGLARVHPLGIGFDVDEDCRALGADGRANEALFIVGPLAGEAAAKRLSSERKALTTPKPFLGFGRAHQAGGG